MRVRLSQGQRVLRAEVIDACVTAFEQSWSRLRVARRLISTAHATFWQMPSPMQPWAATSSCLT
jgi:hypothetical protein